jgi:hypothetical protein
MYEEGDGRDLLEREKGVAGEVDVTVIKLRPVQIQQAVSTYALHAWDLVEHGTAPRQEAIVVKWRLRTNHVPMCRL